MTGCSIDLDLKKISYTKINEYINIIKHDFEAFKVDEEELIKISNLLDKDNRANVKKLATKLMKLVDSRTTEIDRVKKMYEFDRLHLDHGYIAGVDEVGRGPLAGPIVAASVVLDLDNIATSDLLLGIKDSKKLSPKAREILSAEIKNKAVSYSISVIDNDLIDRKGIAWCNNEVFRQSISDLQVVPDLVLSDGYPIKDLNIKNEFVIKGDEKSASIACASIIAKVYRDNLMKDYAKDYPGYFFEENAGYGTANHIDALKKQGPCKIHRLYFLKNII